MAIGDLHGDLDQALKALHLVGAADPTGKWIGGRDTLVQTGDLIDRGPDSLAVLSLLERLQAEAAAAGGQVLLLLGNHELMNLSGDFRYVAASELAWLHRNASHEFAGSSWDAFDDLDVEAGRSLWRTALAYDATAGKALRSRHIAVTAGHGGCRTLFVHAGLNMHSLRAAVELESMSSSSSSSRSSIRSRSALEAADAVFMTALRNCFLGLAGEVFMPGCGMAPRKLEDLHCDRVAAAAALVLLGSQGPLWLRSYKFASSEDTCASVTEVLKAVGANRMVVGHNVQFGGRAHAPCGDRLHMIDVGISRAYGGHMAAWRCSLGADGTPRVAVVYPEGQGARDLDDHEAEL